MKNVKNWKIIMIIVLMAIKFDLFGQAQLTLILTNPVSVSSTQIKWDIYLQNTSSSGEIISLSTANLPQRTTKGLITPAVKRPLSSELEPQFKDLNFVSQISIHNGNTVLRLNGGEPPKNPPVVPTTRTKLGTVTFNCAQKLDLQGVAIGHTVSVPNLSISGFVNTVPTTFSLAFGNLVLQNDAIINPIRFGATFQTNYTEDLVSDIYPNPTTNNVYFVLKSELVDADASATILDAHGRVVTSILLEGQNQGNIDFSGYSTGIYYLVFQNGENIFREKIIKID
ncbi:MAG: T9SS type A sorting domain-containing protein [Saprospiraceae bacterium]|nr:T9SS type A sorting domain-containing protein [Saprospiraceae bacterium]